MMRELKIRNEERLLFGLCRLDLSNELITRIRSLIPVIVDWNYFKTLTNDHGVAALVGHNLEKYQLCQGIPEEVTSFLRVALLKSLSRNTYLIEAISEVLRILNAENIKTVILKGLALENTVYGNSGFRQMSDVDILINHENCLTARKILISNGFKSIPVKSIFHILILSYYGKHLPSLIKNGTSVEIHYELFGEKNNMMTQILYESSYEVKIKDEKTWLPQRQILFLYLVKHLDQHERDNESQIRLYTDLFVLIEKYRDEILNDRLLKYADNLGISEILAWHLEPLRDLWGVSFPEKFNSFIDKWHNEEFINKFLFFLSSPKNNPPMDKSRLYHQIINDIPGLHRKVLYVLGDIFPTVRFMKNRYNCQSIFSVLLHYPHRLGKLIWLFRK